jgi:hypothetical protein
MSRPISTFKAAKDTATFVPPVAAPFRKEGRVSFIYAKPVKNNA